MADAALTCKELVELVTDYLEGVLPQPDRDRFEAHLRTCIGCTRYLDQMRRTIRVVGKLTEESIELKAQEELLQLFRNWKKT